MSSTPGGATAPRYGCGSILPARRIVQPQAGSASTPAEDVETLPAYPVTGRFPITSVSVSVVQMHIAGSCDPDPGSGGWACIVLNPGRGTRVERAGAEWETTGRQMELRALVEGVAALSTEPVAWTETGVPIREGHVELVCDSDYVLTGLREKVWKTMESVGDLEQWHRMVWSGGETPPVENFDLWRRLDELRAGQVGIMPAFQRIANRTKPERGRCKRLAAIAREALAGG